MQLTPPTAEQHGQLGQPDHALGGVRAHAPRALVLDGAPAARRRQGVLHAGARRRARGRGAPERRPGGHVLGRTDQERGGRREAEGESVLPPSSSISAPLPALPALPFFPASLFPLHAQSIRSCSPFRDISPSLPRRSAALTDRSPRYSVSCSASDRATAGSADASRVRDRDQRPDRAARVEPAAAEPDHGERRPLRAAPNCAVHARRGGAAERYQGAEVHQRAGQPRRGAAHAGSQGRL